MNPSHAFGWWIVVVLVTGFWCGYGFWESRYNNNVRPIFYLPILIWLWSAVPVLAGFLAYSLITAP